MSSLGNTAAEYIISYKGLVTRELDVAMGIYELDKKLLLFSTVLSTRNLILRNNDNAFLSNVHIISMQGMKFLVCCSLSTVKIDVASVHSVAHAAENHEVDFVGEHTDCFPDLFIEDSFIHFNSYIVKQFLWNSLYCYHFKIQHAKHPHPVGQTHFNSAFSAWHPSDLCQKPFDENYDVPSIAFLISEAKRKIVWSKHFSKWDHCIVRNNELHTLVGFLFADGNGHLIVSDAQTSIPIILVDDTASSLDATNNNLICEVLSGTVGFYIAVKVFCFVFEKFEDDLSVPLAYICTNLSYALPLEKISHLKFKGLNSSSSHNYLRNNFYHAALENKRGLSLKAGGQNNVSVVTSLLEKNLSFNSSTKSDTSDYLTQDAPYICQEFKVLAKMWSSENEKLVFRKLFAFMLNRQFTDCDDSYLSSMSEVQNSSKLCCSSDCELVELMECLTLQSKYAIINFCRSASKICATLIPGHKYKMFIPCKMNNSFAAKKKNFDSFLGTDKENENQVSFIDVNNVKVHHSSNCLSDGEDDCSKVNALIKNIKDIILDRNVSKTCLVRGILVEKSIENDFQTQGKKILRFVLMDLETSDSINVYILSYPEILLGFLPGVVVEMVGCLCICSQKGNLYLRSSDLFGFHIRNMDRSSVNILSCYNQPTGKSKEKSNIFLLKTLSSATCPWTFRCFNGFVLKITYAAIRFVCANCFRDIEHMCVCQSEYIEMGQVSFIVDDGSDVVSMHGGRSILKKLLKLTENEWKSLAHHVLESKQALKFNDFDKLLTHQSFMTKLFHCICSNSVVKRSVVLDCYLQRISDGRSQLQPSCVCQNLSELCVKDASLELYMTLQKIM